MNHTDNLMVIDINLLLSKTERLNKKTKLVLVRNQLYHQEITFQLYK